MRNDLDQTLHELIEKVRLSDNERLLDTSDAAASILVGLFLEFEGRFGTDSVREALEGWLYQHGKDISIETTAARFGLDPEDRGLPGLFALVLAIVVNRNPNMQLRLERLDERRVIFENVGSCRYRNAAVRLGAEERMPFPMCHVFIHALAERWQTGASCVVECGHGKGHPCRFTIEGGIGSVRCAEASRSGH